MSSRLRLGEPLELRSPDLRTALRRRYPNALADALGGTLFMTLRGLRALLWDHLTETRYFGGRVHLPSLPHIEGLWRDALLPSVEKSLAHELMAELMAPLRDTLSSYLQRLRGSLGARREDFP